MKALSVLKKDMEFNDGLSALLNTLKDISVAQFRALEKKIHPFEELYSNIDSFFEIIRPEGKAHPFLQPQVKKQLIIAVTSDSGLLGGLNMQVVNAAIAEFAKIPGELIVIGEKGKTYAQEFGIPFVAFGGVEEEQRFASAMQVRDHAVKKILDGSFGYLKVAYPRPVSFTVQRVELVQFTPHLSPVKEGTKKIKKGDIIVESADEDIIEYLLYLWMGQKLFDILGLSKLSEFAARFVHLEESAQKLREMNEKLQLEYFRVRHELVDRNMRELFASRLLYAKPN
ncbi:F0F1 ATP synthase subunit gamma [Candidatus Omnitrophota bacterium]